MNKRKKINLVLFFPEKKTFLTKNFLKNYTYFKNFVDIKVVISNKKFHQDLRKKYKKKYYWISSLKKSQTKIIDKVKGHEKLIGIVFQYPWKISPKIIKYFHCIYNFHFGKLPKYRGHNTIIHAILNKEKYFYGTIHKVTKKFDEGNIYAQSKINIKNYLPRDIERKVSNSLIKKCLKILKNIYFGKINKIIKISNGKGKFYSINEIKKLKQINSFTEIPLKMRAFNQPPHEPAYILVKKKKYYLKLNDFRY